MPDQPLADLVPWEVPIRLQLDYRFGGPFRAGLFVELAPGTVAASQCAAGSSCGASSIRVGVEGQVHFRPATTVDPWLALGVGGEVLQADAIVPGEASTQNLSWSGFLPTVSGGVDLAMTGPLSVGPYAQLGIGQYTRGPQGAISSRGTHAWVQLGLKVTIDL